MEEFKRICIEGDKDKLEVLLLNNRRSIAMYIYELISTPQQDIFKLDNISFISYMINREGLFSVLTSKNIRHMFKNCTIDVIKHYLDSYPLIASSIEHEPLNILHDNLDNIPLIELLCNIPIHGIPIHMLNISDDSKLELYIRYSNAFTMPTYDDIKDIASCTNIDLFSIYIKNIKTNTGRKDLYDYIIAMGSNTNMLDMVLKHDTIPSSDYGRIKHAQYMNSINYEMIRHIYTIRTPKRHIFEETIGNILMHNRLDLFSLLLSLAPKDLDIWTNIEKNPSVNIINAYLEHYKLKEYQLQYLNDNIAISDLNRLNISRQCIIM